MGPGRETPSPPSRLLDGLAARSARSHSAANQRGAAGGAGGIPDLYEGVARAKPEDRYSRAPFPRSGLAIQHFAYLPRERIRRERLGKKRELLLRNPVTQD